MATALLAREALAAAALALLTDLAVASHMAMSLRNLNRVFEKHERSVTQWIWQERLALAHRQLADPGHSSRSIGDIFISSL